MTQQKLPSAFPAAHRTMGWAEPGWGAAPPFHGLCRTFCHTPPWGGPGSLLHPPSLATSCCLIVMSLQELQPLRSQEMKHLQPAWHLLSFPWSGRVLAQP